MISRVLKAKGMTMTVADAISAMVASIPNDKYAMQKACGSLGGAKTHAFIEISNGMVTRLR